MAKDFLFKELNMLSLNHDFLSKVKYLKGNHIRILVYLYSWLLSPRPPKLIKLDDSGLLYFYIYLGKVANDLFLSRRQVQDALFRLENKDKRIQSSLQPFLVPKLVSKENKLYIALNPNMIPFVISDIKIASEIQRRLNGNSYNIKKLIGEKPMLIDLNEKPRFPEAEKIATRIIKKYPEYFTHRLPENGKPATKTFTEIVTKIQDIYNGNFLNPRIYPLSEKFMKNKQFDISGYKEVIQNVKGDWLKVKKLIFDALENYVKMWEPGRMPFNKEYIQTNLNLFFYDYCNGEPQSQFIQCLKEPAITSKQLSENKADKIYDSLTEKVKEGGNMLVDLAPKGLNSGAFWQNIKTMAEWCKQVFHIDENCKYWVTCSGEIIIKFAEYCKQNKISISPATVNIEKAIECNGPWVWFIEDAIKEHDLNSNLSSCGNTNDILDCYKTISFDNMQEVIF